VSSQRLSRIPIVAGVVLALLIGAGAGAGAEQPPGFAPWLEEVRAETLGSGLASSAVDEALGSVVYLDRVIELDRRQPELTQTFWRYLDSRVNDDRIARGQTYLAAYHSLLDEVYRQYGVPPRILVALWGMESDYGRIQGDFPVVSAVATLAYDARRSAFFRQQLFAVLDLIERGDVPPDLRGSWAGAIGQPQFIPTTFSNFAVDFDGDGYRDLRGSIPDVLASAARYLSASGWKPDAGWGQEVWLPGGFDYLETGLEVEKPVDDWRRLGVRQTDGSELPSSELYATVLLPAGASGPAFLVYRNFRAILKWNNSVLYALAVGYLSDRLAGGGPLVAERPVQEVPLSRWDVVEMQSRLASLGFEPGEPDGVVGERTRRAIRLFQKSVALPPDGYPDPGLLQQLRGQVMQ